MLNIPSDVKALFTLDRCFKNFHVHFPNSETTDLNNDDIAAESVRFSESICSQQYFKFGLSEASSIEFECVNVPNIKGAVIQCAIEIDVTSLGATWVTNHPVDATLSFLTPQTVVLPDGRYGYRVPYGEFVVDACPRNQGAMYHRRVTAYTDDLTKGIQIFDGETPKSTLTFNPAEWVTATLLNRSEMTLSTNSGTGADYPVNTSGNNLVLSGAPTFRGFATFYPQGTTVSNPHYIGKYAFRFDYQECVFEKYSSEMYDAAIAGIPSAYYLSNLSWTYDSYGNKIYSSTKQGVAALYPFEPFISFGYQYKNASNSYFIRWTKPIFINPGETYILDLADASTFSFYVSKPSGFNTLVSVTTLLGIASQWNRYPEWQTEGESFPINWPLSDLPLDWQTNPYTNKQYYARPGTIKAYFQEVTEDTSLPAMTVKNTLKYTKNAELGQYYTYENAISALDLLVGSLEVHGQFSCFYRVGGQGIRTLSTSSPVSIPKSSRAQFWWDENTIEPIGKVQVTYSDGKEEQTTTITIDADGGSEYEMNDNTVFLGSKTTKARIKSILNTSFKPQASVINFTPIEAEMMGLPYLEAGDYVTLTADDDESVSSFILEQEIAGIQYLRSTIRSTNGELLEVST